MRKGLLVDSRKATVKASPARLFSVVSSIGGRAGWYYANWLWQLRGLLDRCLGGVGMRRSQPRNSELNAGDIVDFWKVVSVEPCQRLLLAAEIKLPGRAWLEFTIKTESNKITLQQTAIFDPRGLSGRLYWYLVFPFHELVFAGLLRGIVRRAECPASDEDH